MMALDSPTACGFVPVRANLLRHTVDLFLKDGLAWDDSAERIQTHRATRGGYRHDLLLLWSEFKSRNPNVLLSEFDSVIDTPHKADAIRDPEQRIEGVAGWTTTG